MESITTIGLLVMGCAALLVFGVFSVSSWWEGERRAARMALAFALATSIPISLLSLAPVVVRIVAGSLILLAALAAGLLFLWPQQRLDWGPDVPRVRVDERDIMFARARLIPGSSDYHSYYQLRPTHKETDDKTRSLPGLLSPGSARYHALACAAARASFSLTEALRHEVDGPVAEEVMVSDPAEMTEFIRALAGYYGAYSVGVTEVQPYHVYSFVGRGTGDYGAPIQLDHRYAIAFSVEMAAEMIGTGPHAATVMESARRYVQAADIALQVATFIRSLGYPARAHIDGNYQVVAPLVARDAGLGEIGRMGLLMTPHLGPRVRLGVVTTEMPLIPEGRRIDASVLDFCRQCKKCADNCPSRAIPLDDRQNIDGALRWRIDSEACFRYWNLVGTDCGRCVAVCPYAHADNFLHNALRWTIRRSSAARSAMLIMDDVFYGRRPRPRAAPAWIPPR